MEHITGTILTDRGFIKGSMGIEDNIIVEMSKKKVKDPTAKGIVIPCFSNAHTHLGDAFIQIRLKGTVEELVAPPHGLKHRLLAKAKEKDVVSGISASIETMYLGGTSSFWDFRESGVDGAKMLYKACLGHAVRPVCLGRPKGMEYNREEISALLRVCDGLGISSTRDWAMPDLQKIALDARRAGKILALHASEAGREIIDTILDLKPSFLVHMVDATGDDYDRCVEANVPIVVCPRSNAFFGMMPDIPLMLSKGVKLLLGTDNAMLNSPSMFHEIDFAFRIARLKAHATPDDIVNMAIRGRKGLSGLDNFGFQTSETACLTVLDISAGSDPYSAVLKSTEADIALIWMGEKKWQRREKQEPEPKKVKRRSAHRPKKRSKSRKRKSRRRKT